MQVKRTIAVACMVFFCCSQALAESKKQLIQGIFYNKDNPRVMIGGNIYSLGDFIAGGEIVSITDESITIKSAFQENRYQAGEVLRPEGSIRVFPKDAPQAIEYLRTIRSLVDKVPIETQPVAAIDAILKPLKQEVAGVNVPGSYRRYHLLVVKLLDITEEAWLCAAKGDRARAKILLVRTARITQELRKQFALLP